MGLADRAAAGHHDGLHKLQRTLGQGWTESHDGFVATVTEIPGSAFNGVTVYGRCDAGELSEALGRVIASGLPCGLLSRPSATDAAAVVAELYGMERQPSMPMMGLTGAPMVHRAEGLLVRELNPEEGLTHAAIFAEGFDASLDLMLLLAGPEMISAPGIHFLIGDAGGHAVTTAIADVNGASAWIYGVSTLAAYRRRGLGGAITGAAVDAARADGASDIFLMSSPLGVRVYTDLGFSALEQWASWTWPAGA